MLYTTNEDRARQSIGTLGVLIGRERVNNANFTASGRPWAARERLRFLYVDAPVPANVLGKLTATGSFPVGAPAAISTCPRLPSPIQTARSAGHHEQAERS